MKSKSIINYRVELFGVAAIWIVLFHVYGNIGFPTGNIILKILSVVISFGNLGVDIFLFISAVGLYFSLKKNSVKRFYMNRVKRVFIPYLLVALIYFIWFDFFYSKNGFLQFILNITTINYWLTGHHPTWYVAFILIAYAVYPLIYILDLKTKHLSTIALILASVVFEFIAYYFSWSIYINCERALSRIPIFLLGTLCGNFIIQDKKIHICVPIISIFVGGVLF
jgi:peptidoglycan/LPS O-acetylase OafA/YrhL